MTSDDRFRALQEEAIDIAYRLADAEDQLQVWGAFAIELDALLDEYGIGRDGEPLIDSVRALVAKVRSGATRWAEHWTAGWDVPSDDGGTA